MLFVCFNGHVLRVAGFRFNEEHKAWVLSESEVLEKLRVHSPDDITIDRLNACEGALLPSRERERECVWLCVRENERESERERESARMRSSLLSPLTGGPSHSGFNLIPALCKVLQ